MSGLSLRAPFEAYNGGDAYIFVSYAHVDGMAVFPELTKLRNLGYRIWYDEGIEPGNEWPEEVARALEGASYFVVYISPASVKSRNVRNEINFALHSNKPFLAIYISETVLPPGLGLQMGSIQAIFKFNMSDEVFLRKIEKTLPITLFDSGDKTIPPPDPPYEVPIAETISKLKNGFYFIMQDDEPYYKKYRDQELPIKYNSFKSQINSANLWFSQAEKMLNNLKVDEAIRFYNRTIQEDPNFIEAYLKLALILWLHSGESKMDDAINYCKKGFELNNNHIIGSFLVYLYLISNTGNAKAILDNLLNSNAIEDKNQLSGLYFLQSKLFNKLNEEDKELESIQKATQLSPFFGPAVRWLSNIYLRKNEFDKAKSILTDALQKYSKNIYCRNWLDTRDMLIGMYGHLGMNEMLFPLLSENCAVQNVLNNKESFPTVKSTIFFEGEIDGNIHKGYLINGTGFNFNQALLQDGLETGNNVICTFNVNDSPELCVFYDLQFGGTIVRIDNISFLMKIVQNNNTGCLIQTQNGFKLTGTKDGFPNIWFINTNSSVQPVNLSLSNSFNLKRI
jgi:tetratricopeptide (TPR) repeat protein